MTKYCVVDFRMRDIEKEYIKSKGYKIIENEFNSLVYDEISSHIDIYFVKVGDRVIVSPEKRNKLPVKCIVGEKYIGEGYPDDVPYNVCIIGKNAIHNFKYTDKELKKYLETCEYNLINVEQGYSKCSIAVIDDTSCIVSDITIATKLMENNIDVLYAKEEDIKLLKRKQCINNNNLEFEYSDMSGFIGGALVRLDDEIILFGDKAKLLNGRKIEKYILSKGLKFKDFPGLDVVDYGGIIEVEVNE